MNPEKNTVKSRIITGIGLSIIERPRELQQTAGTNEHHVVHALYSLEKQGLVSYQVKKSLHSRGKNLTKIRLTPKGRDLWEQIK